MLLKREPLRLVSHQRTTRILEYSVVRCTRNRPRARFLHVLEKPQCVQDPLEDPPSKLTRWSSWIVQVARANGAAPARLNPLGYHFETSIHSPRIFPGNSTAAWNRLVFIRHPQMQAGLPSMFSTTSGPKREPSIAGYVALPDTQFPSLSGAANTISLLQSKCSFQNA